MKTLLTAGLAGILIAAPGTAIAAIESTPASSSLVDLSFASPTAIAASSEGMKAPRAKMRGHGMRGMNKMRGHRMKGMKRHHGSKMRHRAGGKNYGHNRGYRKGHRGRRGVRNNNFGFFYGGFPSLGYSQPAYYVQQPTYRYAQPQPSYYPVPYPVPTPVAYPAPAPTTVVVETVAPKGKGLTKPAARIAAQSHQQIPYDHRVVSTPTYPGGPVKQSGTTYRGDWDGSYREDGSYQGNWQGTYQDAEGRVYEGEYAGTFIGEGGTAPAGASYAHGGPEPRQYDDRDYDRRYSQEQEELAYLQQCRKSSGIGGAVVGGAIGALAGNRIAGRGNRLGGSLIGGGLGAIAGAAIDQGTDRCRKLLKKYGYDRDYADRRVPVQRGYQRSPQQAHHGYGYGYGWQGYYQQPAYYQPQTTTVVIQSQPVTTTTTTTTIEEEYVYEKPKYVAKKSYKPAKRVWKPRAKPAPVLKGCQQANCYYDQ